MKNLLLLTLLIFKTSFSEVLIKNNKLYQTITYNSTSYGFKEGISLKHSTKINSLEATFKIDNLSSKNLTTDILIEFLFQDPIELENNNLKIVRLHIRDKGISPILKGTVIECHDESCMNYFKNELQKGVFNKKIDIKKTHKFKIEHDGNSKNFNLFFNGIKETINIVEDFNPKFFKSARIALSIKNHKGKKSKGNVSVYWDDIFINDKLYDDFNNKNIDNNKWDIIHKSYTELF